MHVIARAHLLLTTAVALALGCAAGPPSRPPETAAALAKPVPDPACHGTVQGLLDRNALDYVTVTVSFDTAGRVEFVDVLSPALTQAAKIELQRAFAECAWVRRPPPGTAASFTTVILREGAPDASHAPRSVPP